MEIITRKKIKITSKGKKTMSISKNKKFIMFYERITKHMIKTLTS